MNIETSKYVRWAGVATLAGASLFAYAADVRAQQLVVEISVSGGSSCGNDPNGYALYAQSYGLASNGAVMCNAGVSGQYEPYGTAQTQCSGHVSSQDVAILGEDGQGNAFDTLCHVTDQSPSNGGCSASFGSCKVNASSFVRGQ